MKSEESDDLYRSSVARPKLSNETIAINVYCDESCHLEHDKSKAMSLGAIWLRKNKVAEVNRRIKEIKAAHGISPTTEIKWTKASPSKVKLYLDLVDYFFDDDDISFRGLVVPDKTVLNHEAHNQTHDDWYYKMYFDMLKTIFRHDRRYFVYVDIKDTNSSRRVQKLHDVCANNAYDFDYQIIRRIQPIRSDEVQIMQIVDILVGALGYRHNYKSSKGLRSSAKIAIVNRIIERTNINLLRTTLLSDRKFNLLVWEPYER